MPVYRGIRDDVFQPLQFPHNQGPMRPRTGVRDIEVVAILFGGELGTLLGRDGIAEHGGLAFELAALVVGRNPVEDV